jgi:hypothetical protein
MTRFGTRSLRFFAAASMIGILLASCSSSEKDPSSLVEPANGVCPSGKFLYEDSACSAPVGSSSCTPRGDGLCHQRCDSNSDCGDDRPYCRILGLFHGYDWNCNIGVRICREDDVDDCSNDVSLL